MDYIFLDDFRGFSNCTIPLVDANFLVGENSTGKTSLLAVLNLLSDPNFWLTQDFNNTDYHFGGFKDILSICNDNRQEFWIGLLRTNTTNKAEIEDCFLLNFKEKDGLPFISKFVQVKNQVVSSMHYHTKSLYYKIDNSINFSGAQNPFNVFSKLKNHISTNQNGYKKLPKPYSEIPKHMMGSFSSVLDALGKKTSPKKNDFFLVPTLTQSFAWLAPIRTEPKRTYDGYNRSFAPDGGHTPYLLKKRLRPGAKALEFKTALERFGISSGLFKEVRVKQFGSDSASPFELQVVLASHPLRINSVGYGVSQVLPVVVELIERVKDTWFGIQQPEVHLHPKAQAALGDLMFLSVSSEDKQIFVETHSDFLIDRFRLNYKRASGKKPSSQVLFFERKEDGNHIHIIPIAGDGEYPEDQPSSFREFFIAEQISILGL